MNLLLYFYLHFLCNNFILQLESFFLMNFGIFSTYTRKNNLERLAKLYFSNFPRFASVGCTRDVVILRGD